MLSLFCVFHPFACIDAFSMKIGLAQVNIDVFSNELTVTKDKITSLARNNITLTSRLNFFQRSHRQCKIISYDGHFICCTCLYRIHQRTTQFSVYTSSHLARCVSNTLHKWRFQIFRLTATRLVFNVICDLMSLNWPCHLNTSDQ